MGLVLMKARIIYGSITMRDKEGAYSITGILVRIGAYSKK